MHFFLFLLATYPADEYRVAKELQAQGFDVGNTKHHDDMIWLRPAFIWGNDQSITSDGSRFICQLPRLCQLLFLRCDASGLNLDEIGNCQRLHYFEFKDGTRFPVSELKKLTACPIVSMLVESKDVDLKDSDLEEFSKFTHLGRLILDFNNVGVTDSCLEYFEKIPTLKQLRLPGSSITPEGAEEFKKKRPDVLVDFE